MHLLAIDPGQTTGLAIVTIAPRPSLVHSETYRISKDPGTPTEVIGRLVASRGAALAVIEEQYLDKNPDSLKKLSRVSGRWEEACAVVGLPVRWIFAATWQARVLKGMGGKRRDSKKAAAKVIAYSDTGKGLTEDQADAYCMGRYAAVEEWARAVSGKS